MGDVFDCRRVGASWFGGAISGRKRRGFVDHPELDIERHVDEHRASATAEGMTGGDGDVVGEAYRLPGRRRPLGDRRKEAGVVHLLEAARMLLSHGVASAEHEHRRVRRRCVHHRRDGVGDTRPGRDGCDPQPAGEPRVRLGGVPGGFLVADVDKPDALFDAAVEDGHDVAPGEREDRIDTLGLEGSCNESPSVDLGHLVLPACCRSGGRCYSVAVRRQSTSAKWRGWRRATSSPASTSSGRHEPPSIRSMIAIVPVFIWVAAPVS